MSHICTLVTLDFHRLSFQLNSHSLKCSRYKFKPAATFQMFPFINVHFKTGPKVMCFSASLFIYFWVGSIGKQLPATNSPIAPTKVHKHTQGHTLFLLLVSLSFWSLCLAFKYIPTLHRPLPTPSMLSPLALPCFSPISPLLKCETARNPIFFFLFFFGQIRGNQKLRNRGSSSITAANHKPALPSVVWCREWFRFGSTKTALTYMRKPIWYVRYIVESVHLHKLALWGRGSERLSTQTK